MEGSPGDRQSYSESRRGDLGAKSVIMDHSNHHYHLDLIVALPSKVQGMEPYRVRTSRGGSLISHQRKRIGMVASCDQMGKEA